MKRVGAAIVGIAVRRVAGVRRRAALETEAAEAWEFECPYVERGNGVDADAPLAVGPLLVEWDDAGIGLDHVQQVVAITHRGEARLLLRRRQTRHIVDRRFLDAHDVASHLWRQRRVGEQLRPRSALRHGDQLVGAKRFLVEKDAAVEPERWIEIGVRAFLRQRHGIDAQRFQQAVGHGAVRPWAVDQQGAAVDQLDAPIERKLVALGVTAEIVVVVEDQDAGVLVFCPIEMRRRQPADAAAHDNEVVGFIGLFEIARSRPEIAVAQAVCGFVGAGMAAAQPGQRRRIIAGRILRRGTVGKGRRDVFWRQPGSDSAAHGNRDAIEEVASRDRRRIFGHQQLYLSLAASASSLAASASRIRSASTAMSTPARSWDSFITTRESRPPQPRPIASVISASVRLHSRIGTPSSRPSALASETSLWASLSENAGGS